MNTFYNCLVMSVSKDIDTHKPNFILLLSILLVVLPQQSICRYELPPRISRRSWAVRTAFERHRIISDGIIPRAPERFMLVKFRNNRTVELGNVMKFDDVWEMPDFFNWDIDHGCYYTLIYLNIDHPNDFFPKKRLYLHWLVGNMPEIMLDKGKVLCTYYMPVPPSIQTGTHRYVFLVYRQPRLRIPFDEPFIPAMPLPWTRANWTLSEFVRKYNLIGPIAGNFYQIDWQHEANNVKYGVHPKKRNRIG